MIRVRPAARADLEIYHAIQAREWGNEMAASLEQLNNRLDVFPGGVLAADHDGRPVAFSTSILLAAYDPGAGRSWAEITGDGSGSTHTPGGEVVFGVDLSISRNAPRATSARMFMALMALTMRHGASGYHWGGRMPRYHRHAETMGPEEYLWARTRRGRYLDPEVELYSRIPGVEILGLIPDYFDDWESAHYGVALRWRNPISGLPFLRPLAGRIPELIYRRNGRRTGGTRS